MRKSNVIQIRVTEEEKKIWQEAAAGAVMTLAEWIREACKVMVMMDREAKEPGLPGKQPETGGEREATAPLRTMARLEMPDLDEVLSQSTEKPPAAIREVLAATEDHPAVRREPGGRLVAGGRADGRPVPTTAERQARLRQADPIRGLQAAKRV